MIAVKPIATRPKVGRERKRRKYEAPVHTTVGELIAILFDETRNLNWLKTHEKQLLVAYLLNDLVSQSSDRNHRSVSINQRSDGMNRSAAT